MNDVEQVGTRAKQRSIPQRTKVRKRHGVRWRRGQQQEADRGVGHAGEVFELLEGRLNLATFQAAKLGNRFARA